MSSTVLPAIIAASAFVFVSLAFILRRIKRCPPDKILVVYGKGRGKTGRSARCVHGGAAFIIPVIQDYRYLDLKPMAIDINLQGALSLQNIRVNTPSTFTVGISTVSGVMENAAERLLEMDHKQVAELARDIIFGQMRVVLATMPIEEINADRDKLIDNISRGLESELAKVGLRLINVNIQDITDESGYIDALGRDAAARAINEAKVKVAEKERDGEIGAANADRDRRIQVASAQATAVEGENEAKVTIANSDAQRREREAEAERLASAAEKVKHAMSLEEAYKAEENAERQRAMREEATQRANVLVPAEIKKAEIETLSEAEAERIRRLKRGEADGLRFGMQAQADGTLFQRKAEADGTRLQMQAEADGIKARMLAEAEGLIQILNNKAEGFGRIVSSVAGDTEQAALLLVTEQLPKLVEEQVKAIANLKIDSVTVWEGGRGGDGGGSGKSSTADFLSGLVGSLPPLHELTKNVGIRLPEYLGRMEGRERGGREPGRGGSGGGRGQTGEDEGGDDGPPAGGGSGGGRSGSGRRPGGGAARPAGAGGGGAAAPTGPAAGRASAGVAAAGPIALVSSQPLSLLESEEESPSLAALRRPLPGYGGGYGGRGSSAAAVTGPAAATPAATAARPRRRPAGAVAVDSGPVDAGATGSEPAASRPDETGHEAAAESAAADAAPERGRRTIREPFGELGRRSDAAAEQARTDDKAAAHVERAHAAADRARERLRSWLASDPRILGIPGAEAATAKASAAIDGAVDSAFEWADRVRDASAAWFHAEGGKWIGPESWNQLSKAAAERPGLPVNLDRKPVWLPYQAIARALSARSERS